MSCLLLLLGSKFFLVGGMEAVVNIAELWQLDDLFSPSVVYKRLILEL